VSGRISLDRSWHSRMFVDFAIRGTAEKQDLKTFGCLGPAAVRTQQVKRMTVDIGLLLGAGCMPAADVDVSGSPGDAKRFVRNRGAAGRQVGWSDQTPQKAAIDGVLRLRHNCRRARAEVAQPKRKSGPFLDAPRPL
jgi:hypothetical protein